MTRLTAWILCAASAAVVLSSAMSARAATTVEGDVTPPDPSQWGDDANVIVGVNSTGAVTVDNGSRMDTGSSRLGLQSTADGTLLITGSGSMFTTFGLAIGVNGQGELTVANGGLVTNFGNLSFGIAPGATGILTVDGAGSLATLPTMIVGDQGTGIINVLHGGVLQGNALLGNVTTFPNGQFMDALGIANISGLGSTWNANSITVGSLNANGRVRISDNGLLNVQGDLLLVAPVANTFPVTYGSTLTVDGGHLTAGRLGAVNYSKMVIANGSSLSANQVALDYPALTSLMVGDGSSMNVADTFTNNGSLYLKAAPGIKPGTYVPLSAGTWAPGGSLTPLGGRWDADTHTFIVLPAVTALTGQFINTTQHQTQRIAITDPTSGKDAILGLTYPPDDFALQMFAWDDPATFPMNVPAVPAAAGTVLSEWFFSITGATNQPVAYSFNIGPGQDAQNLQIWYFYFYTSTWTRFPNVDLTYDGTYANFLGDPGPSYAITLAPPTVPVPEAASLAWIVVGVAALGLRRRVQLLNSLSK